jgi:hypothetical protein
MSTGAPRTSTWKKPEFAELTMGIACGLAFTFTAIFLCVMPLVGSIAGARDYVVYWATGQQLAHHANPYDAQIMGKLEHEAGLPVQGSYYMRNPPWSLPLTLPLGFVSVRQGALPWSLEMLACLALSIRFLWEYFGRPGGHLHWLGYCFAPATLCVTMGQTTLLILLGLVLFLTLHRRRPYLAGIALWFCTLKPHLLLPFGLVLLLWLVFSRRYRILLGLASALAASCVATWMIDPAAWSQYLQMVRTAGIEKEVVPCLSVALAHLISPDRLWLRYLPAALACVWAMAYYWLHRATWKWFENGNLVLLVSLLVAPYCWIYDQPLAIPALLYAAFRSPSRTLLGLLAVASTIVQILMFCSIEINKVYYLWTMPVWLAWYLWADASATRKNRRDEESKLAAFLAL